MSDPMEQFGGSVHHSEAAERERREGRIVAEGNVLTVYRALKQAEAERDAARAELAVVRATLTGERDWESRNATRAEAERDAARALLRELEWCVIDGMQNQHCPICGRFKGGAHKEGCRLAEVLR